MSLKMADKCLGAWVYATRPSCNKITIHTQGANQSSKLGALPSDWLTPVSQSGAPFPDLPKCAKGDYVRLAELVEPMQTAANCLGNSI